MKFDYDLSFAILGGVAIIPFLAKKLKIPSATVEILFGILLFNLLASHQPDWFHFLKEFGFIYLMFLAGIELDVYALLEDKKTLKYFIIINILSLILTPLLFYFLGFGYYTGIVLAVISVGIIIPVLKETNIIKSEFARKIIGLSLTGELLSIFIITLLEIYIHHNGFGLNALLELVKLSGLLIIFAIGLKLIYLFSWWNPKWIKKVMENEDPVEEGVRLALALAFLGAFMAFHTGVDAILGSFLVGVIFSAVFKNKGHFENKISAIGFGFLIPFFFIGVGADFDINLLFQLENVLMALFYTFMIFISNIFIFFFLNKFSWSFKDGLASAVILSAPLSLIVVAASLGKKLGEIDDAEFSTFILTALISSLIFPLIFKFLVQNRSENTEIN